MKILDVPQSGKRGQVVAFQSPFGLCLRQWVVPRNTITPARQHMRAIFGNNSRMWSGTLSQEQRDRWCATGPQVMSHPRLAQRGPLTGQQFWQSISSVRGLVGLPPSLDPPAPVVFAPSVVGRLVIENGADGVRLWLAVSGTPDTDIMVFGQEPCSSGRRKRRNVSYLGLLPPPIGGLVEITDLYKAKYGEPRPGRRVFIVTCQEQNGWKAFERETNEIVPPPSKDLQAASSTPDSQIPLMHKGCTPAVQGIAAPPDAYPPQGVGTEKEGAKAATAGSRGKGGGVT
jgi:hypothetical protein